MAQDPKYNSELDLQFQKIIIEQVQRTQVTSISAHRERILYVGTSDGTITKYNFQISKPQIEKDPFSVSEYVEPSSFTKYESTCSLERGTIIGKSSVTSLTIMEPLDIIAALCDGQIHLLKLKNLKMHATLKVPSGVQAFAFQYYGENRLCFSIKSTLYLYDLDMSTVYKEFMLPEIPSSLCWVGNSVVAAFSRECSRIDVRNGRVDLIWNVNTSILRLLPSGELVLVSPQSSTCVIIDSHTFTVSQKLDISQIKNIKFIAHVYPFFHFVTDKGVTIYDRYIPTHKQEVPFGDVTITSETGKMSIFVNKQNEIIALIPNSIAYQCGDETLFHQVSKDPTDQTAVTQFFTRLLTHPSNPFIALLINYVQKLTDKYYGIITQPDRKFIENSIRNGLKPDLQYYVNCVHTTLLQFYSGFYDDDRSMEFFEETCKNTLSEIMFSKLFTILLLPLYKKLYEKEDVVYSENCKKLVNLTMSAMGIRKKFRLTKDSIKKKSNVGDLKALPGVKLFRGSLTWYRNKPDTKIIQVSVIIKQNSLIVIDESTSKEVLCVDSDKIFFNPRQHSIMWSNIEQVAMPTASPNSNFQTARIDFENSVIFAELRKEIKSQSLPISQNLSSTSQGTSTDSIDEDLQSRLKFLDREDYQPYQSAIEKLVNFTKLCNLSDKLDSILLTIQEAVQCVKEFWQTVEGKKNVLIGADDLVPILCYIVLKAEVPYINAEINCLLDFADDSILNGQLGYSLCTIKTAIVAIELLPGAEKTIVEDLNNNSTTSTLRENSENNNTERHHIDTDFIKKFKLPPEESPLTHYNCGYLYATGRIYVCPSYLIFEALMFFPIGNLVIPMKEIVSVEKSTFALLPSALEITRNGEKIKFNNIINRNEAYEKIVSRVKKANPNYKSV